MRTVRRLRVLLVAALLAGVGSVSLFDGDMPDLVAAGDGGRFAGNAAASPTLAAPATPSAPDPCAVRRGVPLALIKSPPSSVRDTLASQADRNESLRPISLRTDEPPPGRAPPRA